MLSILFYSKYLYSTPHGYLHFFLLDFSGKKRGKHAPCSSVMGKKSKNLNLLEEADTVGAAMGKRQAWFFGRIFNIY